jgi:hypothetical protein
MMKPVAQLQCTIPRNPGGPTGRLSMGVEGFPRSCPWYHQRHGCRRRRLVSWSDRILSCRELGETPGLTGRVHIIRSALSPDRQVYTSTMVILINRCHSAGRASPTACMMSTWSCRSRWRLEYLTSESHCASLLC